MSAELWVQLLIGLGVGAGAREAIAGIWKWATGRQRGERDALRIAWADLEAEQVHRRAVADWGDRMRAAAIRHGADPSELPAYPRRTDPFPPSAPIDTP